MPVKELLHQLEEASLPDPIKPELTRLLAATEVLLPNLEIYQRRRSNYLLEKLVNEAIDPSKEPHWWEVTLDLLAKAAAGRGEAGAQVADAIRSLGSSLPDHMNSYGPVTLREISMETFFGIALLSDTLTEPKSNYVAPNIYSMAQANFSSEAWFRAIYAGKAPVGFLMIVDNPAEAEYFLWRFMIAEPFHGRGYGRGAMERLIEYVRTRPGARELLVSCGQGEGSPEGFYQKLGFTHTGDKLGDEVVLKLPLV